MGLTNGQPYVIIVIESELINMSREEMIDDVIKKFGFESEYTIWFCRVAECPESEINDLLVEIAYQAVMSECLIEI